MKIIPAEMKNFYFGTLGSVLNQGAELPRTSLIGSVLNRGAPPPGPPVA